MPSARIASTCAGHGSISVTSWPERGEVRADIAADRAGADEGDAFGHSVVPVTVTLAGAGACCLAIRRTTSGIFRRQCMPPLGAQPHRGVMEHRATHRRCGIVAGQRVDADATFERGVRPHALRHHDARLQTIEQARMQHDLAARIAEPHPVAIGDAEPRCIGRMQQHASAAPSRSPRRRCLGETGVEELPRRRGHHAERTVGCGLVGRRHVVGQRRHACPIGTDRAPVGCEMEALVGLRKAVVEMRIGERRRDIDPVAAPAPSSRPASPRHAAWRR